jgi:hypothetical protein
MSFIPCRSSFYNTETKRLHAGIVDENGRLDHAGSELGAYTFNAVPKGNPFWSFVVQLFPGGSTIYPPQTFATLETTLDVKDRLQSKFPTYKWSYQGNPIDPADIRDQVNLVATDKDGLSERFCAGDIAFNIMNHGPSYAIETSFATEMADAFANGSN